MLTDCPHCYKKMHEEAEHCPHCTQYVPNAAQLPSSGGFDDLAELIVKIGFYGAAFFFTLGEALDCLGWWRGWEMIPCIVVSVMLVLALYSKLPEL